VSINARLSIKDLLLSTLVSNEIVIMRAGANAIATIASIEIPRQEWLDILTTLAENCQFIEYNIRRASVVTLGFICQ
jgi:importin subunit beta-1